jgi:hypothetical protein
MARDDCGKHGRMNDRQQIHAIELSKNQFEAEFRTLNIRNYGRSLEQRCKQLKQATMKQETRESGSPSISATPRNRSKPACIPIP